MYNDTISDFVTRLRNASMAQKRALSARNNRTTEVLADILKKEGYITSFEKNGRNLDIVLSEETPIHHIQRLSRPSIRRYTGYESIPQPKSGFGLVIISTPKGVLTASQARKQKVGGELICEVW